MFERPEPRVVSDGDAAAVRRNRCMQVAAKQLLDFVQEHLRASGKIKKAHTARGNQHMFAVGSRAEAPRVEFSDVQ